MPKRTDIKSILIIGAGPIVIGQACEFDYSGTQACKTLKAEGYRVVLVNSNPATIMTDPELADATYIEPITPEFVEKIIARERPDALLPTMGGQTALNTAKALAESGVLKKYKVELIGASLEAINKAEDRQLFNEAMARIGLEVAKNAVVKSLEEARVVLKTVGLPAIIRPSFTMGGTGGGIAYNHEEFEAIVASGLDASPVHEVLIDESLLGWKEYEMEVVRDKADNCIIVCSIENIDPMGVHTGDSITVAPALTLTDKEYQIMRNASIAVLREIGVDTGGSNVQFAVNPANGRMVVIEMNPRVSRSSALASKATGFAIAKVAARLAVGYTLDEIVNEVTRVTPASFEPTIDYVVTKIPRFTFEKFPDAEPTLTTAMKSVGEAMSIGRSFPESLQKALRSLETGLTGLNDVPVKGFNPPSSRGLTAGSPEAGTEGDPAVKPRDDDAAEVDLDPLRSALSIPTPDRLLQIGMALRYGMSAAEIHDITKYDPWFIEQIGRIVEAEKQVQANGLPKGAGELLELKKLGFSDARIAELTGKKTNEIAALRKKLGVHPVYKRVDTCAAEFESVTPYMYSCYEAEGAENESNPTDRNKVMILGGGPNRIGQGIEFDYCCVHAAYALKEAGYETIMVNCNPETVSTDYDTSDRLYFEPLTPEDVVEIARIEMSRGKLLGVIVQFGGQTPLKLVRHLEATGIPIIGTSPDSIDLAEDRARFSQLMDTLKLKQPDSGLGYNEQEVIDAAGRIGYPVLVRPSYVLGGRAMAILHDEETLTEYVGKLVRMFGDGPILIDSYLRDAIEVDVDALSDGTDTYIAGIMEHIEEAGIHSGDSACSLPPYSLDNAIIEEIRRQTAQLAKALSVIGLMNVQFAVKFPSPRRGEEGRGADDGESKASHRYPVPHIRDFARDLRKEMTGAEQLLWKFLRGKQLGAKFRKQHPVGPYIADFACLNPRLVIELDGGQHAMDNAPENDAKRTAFLEKEGFRVLRFWNNALFENTQDVLESIYCAVHPEEAVPANISPHPGPPPMGEGEVYVLEVNPRASRTVPFVAKATGVAVAKIAARIMAGEKLKTLLSPEQRLAASDLKHIAVKEAVFPFARFPGVDVILGPEMKSTGEVMGLDTDFARAFAKSQLAAGTTLPASGKVFVSVKESDKVACIGVVRELKELGFTVVCTRGTARLMEENGLGVEVVNKVREGRPHIVDMMKDGHIALMINTTEGVKAIKDSFSLRRTALLGRLPYYTTIPAARAAVHAIRALKSKGGLDVKPLQAYFTDSKSLGRKRA